MKERGIFNFIFGQRSPARLPERERDPCRAQLCCYSFIYLDIAFNMYFAGKPGRSASGTHTSQVRKF